MNATASRPCRVQLSRRKGWRLPAGTVIVSRPSRWGNPFKVQTTHPNAGWIEDRAAAVAAYWHYLAARPELMAVARTELAGKHLACWCPLDQPCHADALLAVANGRTTEGSDHTKPTTP